MNYSFYFGYATVTEMSSTLSKLNVNKGPGPDKIRPKDIKRHCDMFSVVPTELFNKTIDQTSVIPVYKKDKKIWYLIIDQFQFYQ